MRTVDFRTLARLSDELDAEKPYTELIDGVEIVKLSPKRAHGRLQLRLGALLDDWAGKRGEVATEWRFWVVPTGEAMTSLVPDVAFVAGERMRPLDEAAAETPPFAPDVAIEIRSPGDRERNMSRKVALYLAHGSRLVLDVDPVRRVIVAHTPTATRMYHEHETFEHEAIDGLSFEVGALFESARRKQW